MNASHKHISPATRLYPISRRRQTGLSLIELLVGISIGLMVVVAAVGTLVFTRISSSSVDDTVRMQQDASTVMRMIGHQLRQAAAVPIQNSTPDAAFGSTKFQDDGISVNVANSVFVNGTNAARDTVTVVTTTSPDMMVTDCLGYVQPPVVAAVSTLMTNTFEVTAAGEFRCRGVSGNFQAVINNAEDLQILYGFRTGNGALDTLSYLRADQIVAPIIWGNVDSIQVCLRMAGQTLGNPVAAGPSIGCNGENIANDGRIRRVFRQVFTLRNLQS